MRVGVEVGGTFTDLVVIDEKGVQVFKVPSTPLRPDDGAFNAFEAGTINLANVDDLAHGSTTATNAVLERKGYPTAFITTEGFRDILFLQRHGRRQIYDLEYQKPQAVVERKDTFEVLERTLADGSLLKPLDADSVTKTLVPQLKEGGYQAIAICLLNAYVNPTHEEQLRALIQASLPELHITISSDVTREFREYERASTTALSAYVQPVMDKYISRFSTRLTEQGFTGRFSVMQSNGGKLPADTMKANAVTALLSGPAAGVTGAIRQISRSGFKDLITLDMGGTSTDVCVVVDGKPQLTNEFNIDGLPVRIPVLDINTVGAGGGSLIWIDDGGMLRVGPHSAGAQPGPACYDKGGTQPTITDAHVIRNTIAADTLLGGKMAIRADLARQAMQPIADHLGTSVEAAAESAIKLSDSNIVRAIQVISTERGHDPRDSVLVPFGGAGPLHAAQVAQELGIRTIVVPPNAGVISAFGLLASDFVQFESLTRRGVVAEDSMDIVREVFNEMRIRAQQKAQAMRLEGDATLNFVVYMRFVGQAFEVPVELDVSQLQNMTVADLKSLFGTMHEKLYFFGTDVNRAIEFVSFRLGLVVPLTSIPQLEEPDSNTSTAAHDKQLYADGQWRNAILAYRNTLPIHSHTSGPAVLKDSTSTLYIPENWVAQRDEHHNLIMTYMGE